MVTQILLVWALWYMYILVVGIYRAYLQRRLTRTMLILSIPAIAIGYSLDIVVNITAATILFVDLPKELLVTSRLKRYRAGPDGLRKTWATWICETLLDPFDPTGEHC